MSLNFQHSFDGAIVDAHSLKKAGFVFDDIRDFRQKHIASNEPDDEGTYETVLNFSGILLNDQLDVFVAFPKKFAVGNVAENAKLLFQVIARHLQKRPNLYMGAARNPKLMTNFPFAAFYDIYDYYNHYGLYVERHSVTKPNINGKINWKETIRQSDKYVMNGKVTMFPFLYDKVYFYKNFITDCMIYAINYTISKLHFLIDLPPIPHEVENEAIFQNKDAVIAALYEERNVAYRDNIVQLIDHLIAYFKALKEGTNFSIKHYAFASVWEDMVAMYLAHYYKGIESTDDQLFKLAFHEQRQGKIHFEKPVFHPNKHNRRHYFQPDYYYVDDDTQFIFDAKYKNGIHGMDYKQIAYYLFLNEKREDEAALPAQKITYSALILPAEKRESTIHFQMDPLYNKTNEHLIISEEYLDIKLLMEEYVKR